MHIAPAQFSRIADICRRYHVRSLQLFGSAAVGAMQDELSAAFNGRKIDLAFPSVLNNPYRRRAIEPQLRTLYQ